MMRIYYICARRHDHPGLPRYQPWIRWKHFHSKLLSRYVHGFPYAPFNSRILIASPASGVSSWRLRRTHSGNFSNALYETVVTVLA